MYLNFYGLKTQPFNITPDPEFLSMGPCHREAMASIMYGVENRKGFIVVTGEVGVGKTTILRAYLEAADQARLRVVYIFNSNVPFKTLLKTIFRELDQEEDSDDAPAMVDRLHHLLVEEYRRGRNVALIVDEAQNMPIETLENLRMLSNLETSTDKLFQVVLVGQPELEQTLSLKGLRQLRQRVAVHFRIPPFTRKESRAYILYRLKKAGTDPSSVFTRCALRKIARAGRGIPRTLNILCDNSLLTGLGYQVKPVNAGIVREVIRDLEGGDIERRPSAQRLVFPSAALLVLTTALFWVAPFQNPFPDPGGLLSMARRDAPAQDAASDSSESVPPPRQRLAIQKPSPDAPKETTNRVLQRRSPRPRPSLPRVRVVEEGDNLSSMAKATYGFTSPRLIAWIKQRNPKLKDANRLQSGDLILFPEIERRERSGG